MTAVEMADKVVALVERRGGGVSFAEIMNEFGDEAAGDMALELADNVVLWAGMSATLAAAIPLTRDRIEPKPTAPLVYFVDGMYLRYPIAKSVPKAGYKKEHWLPVCFYLRAAAAKASGAK